jgi:glucose-1-phosphate adenylyltransferase
MRNVLSLILGGGRGTRLSPLTLQRSKPAVPIGGKYRLIDIPISNCLNSNIRQIYVLTQFESESLHRHISQTYRFDQFSHGFLEILAASQSLDHLDWYQGTADAVRHTLQHYEDLDFTQYLILAGDHLYRMNYSDFVLHHRLKKADLTISVKPVTEEEARGFGVMKVDAQGRVVRFAEKPNDPALLEEMKSDTGDPNRPYWGSMGIYVFDRKTLNKALKQISGEDFGKNIIPGSIDKNYNVFAFFFKGYWEDIGTIKSFYDANINLTKLNPPFTFLDSKMPIFTHARMLPGTRIYSTSVHKSLINEGCRIEANEIRKSVIGIRSIIGRGTSIINSYIMGNDFYDSVNQYDIPLGIGQNCVIRNAIVDKNVHIGDNVQILNVKKLDEEENDLYWIRDGIVVIRKNAMIPSNTTI